MIRNQYRFINGEQHCEEGDSRWTYTYIIHTLSQWWDGYQLTPCRRQFHLNARDLAKRDDFILCIKAHLTELQRINSSATERNVSHRVSGLKEGVQRLIVGFELLTEGRAWRYTRYRPRGYTQIRSPRYDILVKRSSSMVYTNVHAYASVRYFCQWCYAIRRHRIPVRGLLRKHWSRVHATFAVDADHRRNNLHC